MSELYEELDVCDTVIALESTSLEILIEELSGILLMGMSIIEGGDTNA